MAKKNKQRPKSRVATPPAPAAPADDTNVEESASAAATAAAPRAARSPKLSRSQAASERLEDEYAYIVGDLRRVFILAGVMFALLIVLNVVLSRVGG